MQLSGTSSAFILRCSTALTLTPVRLLTIYVMSLPVKTNIIAPFVSHVRPNHMPPKRGPAEFYIHDTRPAKTRQITVSSSTNNNRRNLHVFSRFYPTTPTEETAAPEADSYDPAPVEAYQAMLDAQTTEASATSSESQSTGIPGINVVTKVRKRYENSVSVSLFALDAIFIDRLRTPGRSPQDLDQLSPRIPR